MRQREGRRGRRGGREQEEDAGGDQVGGWVLQCGWAGAGFVVVSWSAFMQVGAALRKERSEQLAFCIGHQGGNLSVTWLLISEAGDLSWHLAVQAVTGCSGTEKCATSATF